MNGWDRREAAKWAALRRLTATESIRIGESLWTSDLARIARPPPAPRPPSLAVALRSKSRPGNAR